jgi:hypothetical protein
VGLQKVDGNTSPTAAARGKEYPMKKVVCSVSLLLVAALVWPCLAKDNAPKEKTTKVSGKVTKMEGASLTITLRKAKGAATAEEKTVETNTSTKVQVETAEDETKTNKQGKEVKHPKLADGALADVKVGKRVTVTVSADGKTAVSVLVHRERKKPAK